MKSLPAGTDSGAILSDWREVGDLLDQAMFAADSCVYLHLYRLVGQARAELAAALQSVTARLWVPNRVMRQVQDKSRTISASIMREARVDADYVNARISEVAIATLRAIMRTNPHDRTRRMRLRALLDAGRAVEESLVSAGRTHADTAASLAEESTEVSETISRITSGRVGPEPTTAQQRQWTEDSRSRLVNRMPPTDSERTAKEPGRHDDCIIWHEMLEFAMTNDEVKVLAFVTRDVKANGWVEYEGQKRVGAHRDLVREMAMAADTRFIVLGTDDLLAYTKDAAIKIVWKRDAGWGEDHELGSLRPVPSFFP